VKDKRVAIPAKRGKLRTQATETGADFAIRIAYRQWRTGRRGELWSVRPLQPNHPAVLPEKKIATKRGLEIMRKPLQYFRRCSHQNVSYKK